MIDLVAAVRTKIALRRTLQALELYHPIKPRDQQTDLERAIDGVIEDARAALRSWDDMPTTPPSPEP